MRFKRLAEQTVRRLTLRSIRGNLRARRFIRSRCSECRLCTENSVARVAEPRQDISLFIELPIDGGGVDVNLRVVTVDGGDAFGGGDQTNELHAQHASFFKV